MLIEISRRSYQRALFFRSRGGTRDIARLAEPIRSTNSRGLGLLCYLRNWGFPIRVLLLRVFQELPFTLVGGNP
jgi:hypothetical protein